VQQVGPELSRCLLCGSPGFPGSQCGVCIVPRPNFDDSVIAAKCPHCTSPLEILFVGPRHGARIFACLSCRGVFIPARAWALLFADTAVANEIQTRVPMPSIRVAETPPMMMCPSCQKSMDRARFAAMSKSVIDVCRFQHGVWVDAGELRRIVAFEPASDDARPPVHRDRPEIAEHVYQEERQRLEKIQAEAAKAPNIVMIALVFTVGIACLLAGLHFLDCRGSRGSRKSQDIQLE
jgi:Zn-finger nucleic acid-binding protein